MKKIHQVAWKFGTQNLVATCTLILRKILEHFTKFILCILYIFLKLYNSRIQSFKWCVNHIWNEKVMTIWRQLHKVETPFRNDFEIQFMISKFNLWIEIHLEMTLISKSHTTTLIFHLLYFDNCILGTPSALNGPYTTRNHDFIIFFNHL